jgi:hypothetical protein
MIFYDIIQPDSVEKPEIIRGEQYIMPFLRGQICKTIPMKGQVVPQPL